MTIRTRTYLKTRYETGDKPSQTDFSDMIDSLVSVAEDPILTQAEKDKLDAISGTNTGDETATSIVTKIGDGSKISATYLPSYVDDVLEVSTFSALPTIGESGKIYITLDTNHEYRWSGSTYVDLSISVSYATQAEAEAGLENTKVMTSLRVLQSIIYQIANYTFSSLTTTSKTIIGAINELKTSIASITISVPSPTNGNLVGMDGSGNLTNSGSKPSDFVTANSVITGATKTKITYDAKGLVLSGADATTADIADSSNKRYVTDTNLTTLGNQSGSNTGDETPTTIKTKLGVATDSVDGYLTATDHATFNNKQSTLGFTAENVASKATDLSSNDNTHYPTTAAVKTAISSAVTGLLNLRGGFDASANLFPSTSGSGISGAILKGDSWYITIAGTLGSTNVAVGDLVSANVNSPGQTPSNWLILEVGFGYTPENVVNKDIDGTLSANSDTKYTSQRAAKTYADTKEALINKVADLTTNDNTHYPTVKAVQDQITNLQNQINNANAIAYAGLVMGG